MIFKRHPKIILLKIYAQKSKAFLRIEYVILCANSSTANKKIKEQKVNKQSPLK